MDYRSMLASILSPKPALPGIVGQAQQAMDSRPYQLHVAEAKALGQTPLTQQQFAAQQLGQ